MDIVLVDKLNEHCVLRILEVKMEDSKEHFEIFDKMLIDQVKERPTLYYTDLYSESDEHHWDGIQKKTGMQSSYQFSVNILQRNRFD